MKVLSLPFTQRLGIVLSDNNEYLLQLNNNSKLLNHIDTIHASASYALAEITSGYFLNTHFADIADQTIPILRSSAVKYNKTCKSTLYSKAELVNTTSGDVLLQLKFKRKCLLTIAVKLYDTENTLILTSDFKWFVTMKE